VNVGEDEDCEEDEEDDPVLMAKLAKLRKLQQLLREKEMQFRAEADWMTQAETLIQTLRRKTTNVKLHLKDLHKQLIDIHFGKKKLEKQLEGLEEKDLMANKLKNMEKELAELMSHSENVKQQVEELNSKKVEYRSKIEEIKQAVNHLKQKNKADGADGAPAPFVRVIENGNCPCHLPITSRPKCSCGY